MNLYALKKTLVFLLFALLLAICVILLYNFVAPSPPDATTDADAYPIPIIVIDAGHGGADGGAVAIDGTLEKELNLEIAKKLSALAEICGYNTVMTRTDDVMLSAPSGAGSAKMQDLRARLEIASKYPNALTISIHCNKFPLESCKGLQVYHSVHTEAENSAKLVQSTVISAIQPENHRAVKKADSSIYLLDRAASPSILIECGFLSNTADLTNLKDEVYQKKLALCILKAIST